MRLRIIMAVCAEFESEQEARMFSDAFKKDANNIFDSQRLFDQKDREPNIMVEIVKPE